VEERCWDRSVELKSLSDSCTCDDDWRAVASAVLHLGQTVQFAPISSPQHPISDAERLEYGKVARVSVFSRVPIMPDLAEQLVFFVPPLPCQARYPKSTVTDNDESTDRQPPRRLPSQRPPLLSHACWHNSSHHDPYDINQDSMHDVYFLNCF
jgi:hypothetical protein